MRAILDDFSDDDDDDDDDDNEMKLSIHSVQLICKQKRRDDVWTSFAPTTRPMLQYLA
ncbi:hypothetical protein CERZMDRAFT_91967 [Cercospora zeae-maydis SCOH1-5]|uniref:Uncharacterized protein n=1 Tax=Cercospora zeae-maydis SCOH1-5 TaxID=717836 RepID=A0A6A6F1J9_9PEZI|nr:hypothetical protein CERZMDRAFT_91967 [Cercospora zeae-maydis SCOH1-5]